jgi:ubiquitin-protein ligase E3 A
VEDVFCRTFEISYEAFGKIQHIPLIPEGSDIVVSNANREQYVKLFIKHYVHTSVHDRFLALQQGFYNVCGGRALAMCRPIELELLLCGTTVDDSDFLKLQEGASYDDGYSASHIVIK